MHSRASLQPLLEDYTSADPTEEGYRIRMLDLLGRTEDPCSRSSFQPGHFTASTFVLDPSCSRLLLILHRSLGLWLQPGGHFDPEDRSLEEAARREVSEETGVQDLEQLEQFRGLFDIDIHSIPANPGRGEPAHQHFDLRLAFRAGSNAITASTEVAAAKWVPLEEVRAAGADRSVRRAVSKLIGRKHSFSDPSQLL